MNGIRILIVEDEALVRQGMKALLEKESKVKGVKEAWDRVSFCRQMDQSKFDLILLDVRLQQTSGLELMEIIKNEQKPPQVIAVTGLEGVEVVINLLKAGVNGIVFKLDGYDAIWSAITRVMEGDYHYPQKIIRIIQSNAHRWDNAPPVVLTFAEMELLRGIAQGFTTKEIAESLKMSPSTMETYRIRLIKKMDVSNTASLMAYAFRNGLL